MVLNKKGMFFTTITLLIISLFLFSYAFYSFSDSRKTTQNRVETMDAFIFSIEKDLQRQLYIASYRSIFIIEQKIIESGTYNSNVSQSVQELFFNGTINSESQPLMQGITLSDILNTTNENARKINLQISIQPQQLSVSQDNPWEVLVELKIILNATDSTNVASWNRNQTITARVKIENFEDPLYLLNTNGAITNKFVKAPTEQFVSGTDTTNLVAHATNSYYIASSDSPSFIDRLEGRNTANANGIESLVNVQEHSSQGLPTYQKSIVDHIYFSAQNPSAHRITGTPSWFYLDDAHLDEYQVTGLVQ